jgi:hypothetical protein
MNKFLTAILITLLLCAEISCISIPLVQNTNRCMIVYTSSPEENLILDMKFPKIPNQVNG